MNIVIFLKIKCSMITNKTIAENRLSSSEAKFDGPWQVQLLDICSHRDMHEVIIA